MKLSRIDRGRFFPPKYEARRIDNDILRHQLAFGQAVSWYFYDPAASRIDPVFDEGDDIVQGRRWRGPYLMPVLSANRRQGTRSVSDDGLYSFDSVYLRMSYEQIRKVGFLPEVGFNTETHLRDRFVYAGRVFGIHDIQLTGQFEASGHYPVVHVAGSQLRNDDLYNDVDFAAYIDPPLEDIAVTASRRDLYIEGGAEFTMTVQWQTTKNPLDYAAELQIRDIRNDDPALLTLTDGHGITISSGGDIDIVIVPADTTTLAAVRLPMQYDLRLVNTTNPDDAVRLISGDVFASAAVSR